MVFGGYENDSWLTAHFKVDRSKNCGNSAMCMYLHSWSQRWLGSCCYCCWVLFVWLFFCWFFFWGGDRSKLRYRPNKFLKDAVSPMHCCWYWTDGQNTALSCTTTRPMEIHQYWTVPRQTQLMTTPSITEKWRLQYNHWRKRGQLELTTSQQNWSKQVERM